MADILKDPIPFMEEMLRKARRGEVVLTCLKIKNMQPDRWERGAGPDRLRMDNRFMIEMEMYAPDRGARTQAPMSAVAVDIDPLAADVLTAPSLDYVTLQGDNRLNSYRVPLQPMKSLPERIMRAVSESDLEYNTLRITYETRDRLTLAGILNPLPDESPATFLGLDLIIEAPDGRPQPRFEDSPTEYFDEKLDRVTGNVVSRRTLNEVVTQDRYVTGRGNVTRGITTRLEPAKPKTPAGASAAREIIFDD